MENLQEQADSMIQFQVQSETKLANDNQFNNLDNFTEKLSDIPGLKAPSQNLYNDVLRAELIELQSDTDLLFQQLQALSRRRLSQVGSFS
jgi:hypothetical protein